MKNLKVVILAAGQGKRLQSEQAQIPKAMRKANGNPLLHYVLKSADFIEDKKDIIIVVGFLKEMIMQAFPEYMFAIQEERKGTGHAVKITKELLKDYTGNILILLGDMPLIQRETVEKLIETHEKNGNKCTVLSCNMDEVLSFGRIIRDENNNFVEILENKDCPPELKNIKEYNTGVMIFDSVKLFEQLENLQNNNNSGEYYLTDVPKLFNENYYKVGVYATDNQNEFYGVSSEEDLKFIENILKYNSAK